MSDVAHIDWEGPNDRDRDALALVACLVLDDLDAAAGLLESLDKSQATALLFTVALWHSRALKHTVPDPLQTLRGAALDLHKEEE
jgi:hypothetical protein